MHDRVTSDRGDPHNSVAEPVANCMNSNRACVSKVQKEKLLFYNSSLNAEHVEQAPNAKSANYRT